MAPLAGAMAVALLGSAACGWSTVTVSPATGNFPYHPTDAGRAEMAGLVEQAIDG